MMDCQTGEIIERRLDHQAGEARKFYAALLQKSDSIPNALPPDRLGDGQKRLHLPI